MILKVSFRFHRFDQTIPCERKANPSFFIFQDQIPLESLLVGESFSVRLLPSYDHNLTQEGIHEPLKTVILFLMDEYTPLPALVLYRQRERSPPALSEYPHQQCRVPRQRMPVMQRK